MPDSNRGKHCGLSYTLQNRPAVVKVENLHNLAIVDARRWSIKFLGTLAVMEMQTLCQTLVEVEAKALLDSLFKTRQETLTQV